MAESKCVQRAGQHWTYDEKDYLRRALDDGHTLSAIGRVLGRTSDSVRRQAQEQGIKLKRVGPQPKLVFRLSFEHYQTLSEMGDELSMAPSQMARMIVVSVLRDQPLRDLVVKP